MRRLLHRGCSSFTKGALGLHWSQAVASTSHQQQQARGTGQNEADDDDDDLARMLSSNAPPKAASPHALSGEAPETTLAPLTLDGVPSSPVRPMGREGALPEQKLSAASSADATPPTSIDAARPPTEEVQRMLSDYRNWARSYVRTRTVIQKRDGQRQRKGSMFPNPGLLMEWLCIKCMKFNPETMKRCLGCKSEAWQSKKIKFPPVTYRPVVPDVWWCWSCKTEVRTPRHKELDPLAAREHLQCSKCNDVQFAGLRPWHCDVCSRMNPRTAVHCEYCAQARAVTWTCQGCSSKNCIFWVKCADCSTARNVVQETDHLTKCNNCSEMNGVSWEVCSGCAAPLPAALPLLSSVRMSIQTNKGKEVAPVSDSKFAAAFEKSRMKMQPRSASMSATLSAMKSAEADGAKEKWLCPICFRQNDLISQKQCIGCSYVPAESILAAAKSGGGAREQVDGSRPTSTWGCLHCGGLNPKDTPSCTVCGEPNPKPVLNAVTPPAASPPAVSTSVPAPAPAPPSTPPATTPKHAMALKPGEWRCSGCSSNNSPLTRRCVKCSSVRIIATGFWQCEKCFSVNKKSRDACVGCYMLRPVVEKVKQTESPLDTSSSPSTTSASTSTIFADAPRPWRCDVCARLNAASNSGECSYCNAESSGNWVCASCTKTNIAPSTACVACGVSRPIQDKWCCPLCREWNSGQRCFRCTVPKSSQVCEFVPAEWDCPACMLRNSTRALFCNGCNGPRVVAKMSLTVTCSACSKVVDVGPSELCTNCQEPLSKFVSNAVFQGSPFSLSSAKSLWLATSAAAGPSDSGADKDSEGGVTHASASSFTKSRGNEEADGAGVDHAVVGASAGNDDHDMVTSRSGDAAEGGGSTNRKSNTAEEEEEDEDDELLRSFTSTDANSGTTASSNQPHDQFWTCSLCAAKNSDDTGECTVCGMSKADD